VGLFRIDLGCKNNSCNPTARTGQKLWSQPFLICSSSVSPSSVVRDLGAWIDNGLTMSTHITKVVAGCFPSIRQLHSVRRSLSQESFTRLTIAVVLSRLDYCSGALAGLPASQLSWLQSVLHAAARLIHCVRRHNHLTPLLQQLHWLPVPEHVNFKLCFLVYHCLHGLGTEYFSEDFKLMSEIQLRQRLRSASSTDVMVPPTSDRHHCSMPPPIRGGGIIKWNVC